MGVTRFRDGLGWHEFLGQDRLARYTTPQAQGAVGDEVLISGFYLYDRDDVVIPNGYILFPLPFFFTCFPFF